jgi:hypothetical protein
MSGAPLLRPEFGPPMPALLRRRFGISARVAALLAVAAVVVLAIAVRVVTDDGRQQLTVHGKPSFNLLYDAALLHRAAPAAGELMRLEGRRKNLSVAIFARRANLPPYSGDVIGGQLPLYVAQYAGRLETRLDGFLLTDEGKARLNQAPGYQLGYTSGQPGNRTFWREVFVLPDADSGDQAILFTLRQTFSGRPGRRGRALLKATKKAFRSFRFGTGRPLFQGG